MNKKLLLIIMFISSLFFILSCKNNVNNPNVYFQDQPITSYSGIWKGNIYDTVHNNEPISEITITINKDGSIDFDGDMISSENVIAKGNNTFEFTLYDNLTLGDQIVDLRYVNTLKITDNNTMDCSGAIDIKSGEYWETLMNISGNLKKQ